jgi:hypothetical protein
MSYGYEDRPSKRSLLNYKTVAGVSLASVFSFAALYAISPRVTDRDAALKIVRGALVDHQVQTGVKMDALLPQVEYIILPQFLQKTSVSAEASGSVTIRTKEKARIQGTFEIHWSLDSKDENFRNIYEQLNADTIEKIEPFIRNFAIPAAIDVYKDVPTAELSDNLTKVGGDIAASLQRILDAEGYTYIKVKTVIPSGVGLSEKANADLEAIVSEQRRLDLLKVQQQVAEASVGVTAAQTAVTTKAFKELEEAGVPKGQLVQAYYLQLMRDGGFVGKPFVPGPIPGTGVGAVPSFEPNAPK